jgi:ribosomal protein S18 acetylase RimI-like enzyme
VDSLIRIDKTGIGKAAETLSAAFFDYPIMEYLFPSPSERQKGLPYLFEYYLYYSVRYGEVYATSTDMEGIAIWLTSENYHMSLWRLLCSIPLTVIYHMGSIANERMKQTDGYMDKEHQRLLAGPHWYLGTLGVRPEKQGKGYAGKMLRPMLARADTNCLPCYLETQIEARVPLYKHFGFHVIEKSTIPGTNLTNWAMLRELKE